VTWKRFLRDANILKQALPQFDDPVCAALRACRQCVTL
jgi:hypothetical protein